MALSVMVRVIRGLFPEVEGNSSLHKKFGLEVEAYLCRHGTRGDVVRSAEGGEKVVERVLVRNVDGR